MIRKDFVFTSDEIEPNWFYKKYFYGGGNSRYWTFQMAMNLLSQQTDNPVIIETGCQRQEDDLGAGMSTSIFGEYCKRYGGKCISVDLIEYHLNVCKRCTVEYAAHIDYVLSDSLEYLRNYNGPVDLLYLDSLDYPIGDNAGDETMRMASQTHCLLEFKSIEPRLQPNTVLLVDDNMLPFGGKPKLLKTYLESKGWTCLFDYQQSLWIRR